MSEYAQAILDQSEANDVEVRKWAREAQRMVAWHAICLLPYKDGLAEAAKENYAQLLTEALDHVDPRAPLVVPVAARSAMLELASGLLLQLVESRTAAPQYAG